MATRQMKMPDKKSEKIEDEPFEHFSQSKRSEVGRYLLQVDRQTKGSYQTAETAESSGRSIKKDYPLLHVAVYDSVEFATSIIADPAK